MNRQYTILSACLLIFAASLYWSWLNNIQIREISDQSAVIEKTNSKNRDLMTSVKNLKLSREVGPEIVLTEIPNQLRNSGVDLKEVNAQSNGNIEISGTSDFSKIQPFLGKGMFSLEIRPSRKKPNIDFTIHLKQPDLRIDHTAFTWERLPRFIESFSKNSKSGQIMQKDGLASLLLYPIHPVASPIAAPIPIDYEIDLRFQGTISQNNQSLAGIFQSSGSIYSASAGDTIKGWEILEISPETAILTRAGQNIVLSRGQS